MMPVIRSKTLLLLGLAAAAGGVLGGAAMLGLLYQKPGERMINRALVDLGLRDDIRTRYAFGLKDSTAEGDWRGVRSPEWPMWKVRPGLDVERVATGFTYPVNLAFALRAPATDDAPWFYVNELHGTVKFVTRTGKVGVFADGLINFDPIPQGKSDESGLSGLVCVPGTEDLIATTAYLDEETGLLSNKVIRLHAEPGGRRAARISTVLDLRQWTAPSNQIQQALIGADGKLYVSVGDAESPRLSLDHGEFGGKVLRMELDGSACRDNPFFDVTDPTAQHSYIWVYGLRNVFDFDQDPVSDRIYAVDNGKLTDRLVHLDTGASYGWNGTEASILTNAAFSWHPSVSPCGIAFLRQPVLGPRSAGRLYVACYGPPTVVGPNDSKKILEFELDSKQRLLTGPPTPLVQNRGPDRMTVLGLAEGPGGLFFTDFFGATDGSDPDGAGSVWRVVTSPATEELFATQAARAAQQDATKAPAVRGQAHFKTHCSGCHRIHAVGGREGPDLTRFARSAKKRLMAPGYVAELEELLASEQSFLVEQRPRLQAVLDAGPEQRVRVWLHQHIAEPRFDNPRARMPGFGHLPEATREDLVAYLLQL